MRRPFPDAWRGLIEKNVPYVARLSREDRDALAGHVQVFLAEKRFEGCGGLEITDEVRVTIAAQACILLLHRETDYYPNLVSILVYPTTYVVRGGRRTAEGLIAEGPEARLGESWARDVVVLAWDSVLSGAADIHDGQTSSSTSSRINWTRRARAAAARRCFPAARCMSHGRECSATILSNWCGTWSGITALLSIGTARPIRPNSSRS
jgi:hypothetical protein